MIFYYENNQCFVRDLILSRGEIDIKYFNSDTEVIILKHGTLNQDYYTGLITDLTKKNGLNYTNKADIDAVLPDFFDISGPFIISSATLLTNSIIHVILSKGGYGDNAASTPVDISDVTFGYTDNSDTLIGAELLALSNTSGGVLVGGETEFYIHNYLEGQSDGLGTIEVTVNTDAIFDSVGTAMADTETTGVLTLSSETIDWIPNTKGIGLYADLNDSTSLDANISLYDKSNNERVFSQSNVSLRPTNDIATSQSVDFTTAGQYLTANIPVWLDTLNGCSLFFVYERASGDQMLIEQEAYIGKATSMINYIMIRNTSVLFARNGAATLTFTYTMPAGYRNIEFRINNAGTDYYLYVDGDLKASSLGATYSPLSFMRIGADNVTQGLNQKLRNITLYNGTDSTIRTAITTKLTAKFITQSELSNVHRINYLVPLKHFTLWGDSQAIGRDVTGNLTAPYQYILGNQVNSYIGAEKPTNWEVSTPYNPDTKYGLEVGADNFGVEASAIYWLLQTNNYCAVTKLGTGSTTLNGTWKKSLGTSYYLIIWKTENALQFLKEKMFNAVSVGCEALIGSNDSTVPGDTTAFSANWTQIAIDIRADFILPNYWMVSKAIQNGVGAATINAALEAHAAGDSYHYHDTTIVTLKDGVHYDADGCVIIGKNAADNALNI